MLRRRRPQPVPAGGRPSLLVTNLDTDFVVGGPLAHPGADAAAPALVAEVAQQMQARDPHGDPAAATYSRVTVLVEGALFGPRQEPPPWCPLPSHGAGAGFRRLLAGVPHSVECPMVWEACPACGGDPLAASFNGKDHQVTLRRLLEYSQRGPVHLAGLGLDHGGLEVAEALAGQFAITVFAGRSTFLDPEASRRRLVALEAAGATVDWAVPV